MVRMLALIIEVVELLVLLSVVIGTVRWAVAKILPSRAPLSDCRDLVPVGDQHAKTKHAQ